MVQLDFIFKTSDMALNILDFSHKSCYATMKDIQNDVLSAKLNCKRISHVDR